MKNNTETNTKVIKINFQAYGVPDKANGGIDHKATVAKFEKELKAWSELQSNDITLINRHLDELYAGVPAGTAMFKQAVVSLVMGKIGFTNDTYSDLNDRVVAAIDSNKRYYTQLGLGGGLKRMTDEEFAHFQNTNQNPAEVAQAAKKAAAEKKAQEKASKAQS